MQVKVDLKVFLFFLIFLVTRKIHIYSILMLFSLIHELGHLVCGIALGFKPEKMTILPYGLKINFRTKVNDYNTKFQKGNLLSIKKMIIAMAGPLTNVICIIATIIIASNQTIANQMALGNEMYSNIIYANLLIAIFNMLPIYPLDGGRILKEIIHINLGIRKSYKYIEVISEITLYLLTAITSMVILQYKNPAIVAIIIYLWIIVYKNKKEIDLKEKIYKEIKLYENSAETIKV